MTIDALCDGKHRMSGEIEIGDTTQPIDLCCDSRGEECFYFEMYLGKNVCKYKPKDNLAEKRRYILGK